MKAFCDEVDPKTGRPVAIDKLFTQSVHKKSAFFKFIKTVTGTEPKPDGSKEFDTDTLINRTFRCKTERVTNERGTWAHIVDFEPAQPGDRAVPIPLDFRRGENNQLSGGDNGFTADPADAAEEELSFPGTETE